MSAEIVRNKLIIVERKNHNNKKTPLALANLFWLMLVVFYFK